MMDWYDVACLSLTLVAGFMILHMLFSHAERGD